MSAHLKVLVVDDESQIRRFLKVALEAHGYEVSEAATGREGIAKAATETPDLVVLDLGLPDMDGKAAIEQIRGWSPVPILVLSVRQAEADKVAALDAGAQDYVVKPFGIAELTARIRSILRDRTGEANAAAARIDVGPLSIDVPAHEVRLSGATVKLTPKEFDLLLLLARHAGRILTHQTLLREIWGKAHEADSQYLRVFVRQLRQKLGDDPGHPRFIVNEPGVGYRLLDTE